MHMLDVVQLNYDSIDGFVPAFVAAAMVAELPPPGGTLKVSPVGTYDTVRLHAPYDDERPTGVAFEPLLSALGVSSTVRLLGALMLEQRVIFIGSRLGHVSSCAHAALTLLYPLKWQHIFIPILPTSMLSYACAPMPYVLGILARHVPQLEQEPIEDALYVHLDSGRISGGAEAGDVSAIASLPRPIMQSLERSLSVHVRHAKRSRLDNQAVADAVLNLCMVQLFGHYRRFVREAPLSHPVGSAKSGRNESLHPLFDDEGFFEGGPAYAQPFLRAMRSSQLLEAFVREFVEMDSEAREHSAFERARSAPLPAPQESEVSPRGAADPWGKGREVLSKAAMASAYALERASNATAAAEQRFGPALVKTAAEMQQRAALAASRAQQRARSAVEASRRASGSLTRAESWQEERSSPDGFGVRLQLSPASPLESMRHASWNSDYSGRSSGRPSRESSFNNGHINALADSGMELSKKHDAHPPKSTCSGTAIFSPAAVTPARGMASMSCTPSTMCCNSVPGSTEGFPSGGSYPHSVTDIIAKTEPVNSTVFTSAVTPTAPASLTLDGSPPGSFTSATEGSLIDIDGAELPTLFDPLPSPSNNLLPAASPLDDLLSAWPSSATAVPATASLPSPSSMGYPFPMSHPAPPISLGDGETPLSQHPSPKGPSAGAWVSFGNTSDGSATFTAIARSGPLLLGECVPSEGASQHHVPIAISPINERSSSLAMVSAPAAQHSNPSPPPSSLVDDLLARSLEGLSSR